MSDYILKDTDLQKYSVSGKITDDNSRIAALIRQQSDPQSGWPRYIQNLEKYSRIQKECVTVQGIEIVVMLNESRAPSITATTFESNSKSAQLCLLCNLDKEQKGIPVCDSRYLILANPGITILGDLTIASVTHQPQLIDNVFNDMINLASSLTDYSIYYNGALAGASSPHLHFQAGKKNTLVAENQINDLMAGKHVGNVVTERIFENRNSRIVCLEHFLRAVYVITSKDRSEIDRLFFIIYQYLKQIDQQITGISNVPDYGEYIPSLNRIETEPRMNLMLKFDPKTAEYLLVIFPKIFNRPNLYFRTDQSKIIVGMAVKESLGNLICCREQDYHQLLHTPEMIVEIYRDTSISTEMVNSLNHQLKSHIFS